MEKKSSKFKAIGVFCASAMGNSTKVIDEAKQVGFALASKKITLVYGGASVGIMGVVADAVLENDGTVIGIIPSFFSKNEIAHNGITELLFVDSMAERKRLLAEKSDAFLVLPGGFGTLDELFEVLTLSQLNLHQKPVGILNIDGFYNSLIEQLTVMNNAGFLRDNHYLMFVHDTTIAGLFDKMEQYQANHDSTWLSWAKEE